MKQLLAFCMAAVTFLLPMPAYAFPLKGEDIQAEAAVLMDADTGQILYSRNGEQRMAPASITKIMTALLALENLDQEEVLIASEEAVNLPDWGSSAGIQAGERLTVRDTLYALMLPSANEAGNILAEAVSGTQKQFVSLMNQRARELGAEGTHFANAHGLPAPAHYTTARDMAMITRQAIQTAGFLDCAGASAYTIPATNLSGERLLTHVHRMLRQDSDYFHPDVIGGKTGYTDEAGHTLVTIARREGRTLICVVMKDDAYYEDTRTLLEYGFTSFSSAVYLWEHARPPVFTEQDDTVGTVTASFRIPGPVEFLLPTGAQLSQITVEYESSILPQSREKSGAYANLILKIPEEPPLLLLSVPLELESWAVTPLESVEAAAQPAKENPKKIILLPFVLLLLPCFVAVKKKKGRHLK